LVDEVWGERELPWPVALAFVSTPLFANARLVLGSSVKMDPPPQRQGRLRPKTRRNRASAVVLPDPIPPPPPPSPPKPKKPAAEKPATPRKRKAAPDDDEGEEKRLKRYRDHAPQSVMVKWERVMTQRMFMLERSGRKDGALSEDFSVLGSTGNLYVVNVSQVPTYGQQSPPTCISPLLLGIVLAFRGLR
jgi:hypothetical protein